MKSQILGLASRVLNASSVLSSEEKAELLAILSLVERLNDEMRAAEERAIALLQKLGAAA